MASLEPQQSQTDADSAEDNTLQRPPRSLHRVSSKHLGSGSGAGLWLSSGNSPSDQAISHKAEYSSDRENDSDAPARVRFHDSAKSQAVSPTAATPTSRGSKLYHFPATLARGLRFLATDSNSEETGPEETDPVAKLQEHNLLRMTSKEELEQSVDLDLSFDFVSTAERPLPPAGGRRSALSSIDLQNAFALSGQLAPAENADYVFNKSETPLALAPSSPGKGSPGRGMAATNWSSRPAKQPPLPLDLSATNPAKLSSGKDSMDIVRRSSSTSMRPSAEVTRMGSIRTMNSLDSGRLPGESEPRSSESMSFVSHRSNQSRSSRGSRAPPSLPPSGPLPPIPDSLTSARGSLASNRGNSTLKPMEPILSYDTDGQEFSGDEYREELRDSETEKLDEDGKRASGGSAYSGESGESFKTAGIGSMAHSSMDNISRSGSQISNLPPLPTVPSVIWRQRQQRIEKQVVAAATTRASAVAPAFAIDSVVIDKSALITQALPQESPRMSFGFQSPTPEKLKRWSSIPSQLAALVVGADGPIKPIAPPLPTLSTLKASPKRDTLSPLSDARTSLNVSPTTDSSSPFSPLFSDPGTAVSSGTTMSRASTESAGVPKSSGPLPSMFGLGLGLDLGLVSELQAPKSAHLSLSPSTHTVQDSALRRTASAIGLTSNVPRKSNSPHTELDMTIFADQGPEPTVVNLHSAMHATTKPEISLSRRRSRLLDMLHSDPKSAANTSTAVAVDNFEGSSSDQKKPRALSVANTPSTLPMLSPRPISSPYLGRLGMDVLANSSVEAFACNVTPPMPSVAFTEREPAVIKRAGEERSDRQLRGSSWLDKAQSVQLRLSYHIATAPWMPTASLKQDHAKLSSRQVKEKQSPLPTATAVFERTSEGRLNHRMSMASAVSNPDSRMRRRRSTMTTWSPISDQSATLHNEPRVMAGIKGKAGRTKAVFGNAAYNSPARSPATTNMLPNGTLLSKCLFFAGFCFMPWLWLIGGWWLESEGVLVNDVIVKTIRSRDSTADTDSDLDSNSDVGGEGTVRQRIQYYDVLVRKEWSGLEPYVRYNRIASVFGASFILLAFILALWGAAISW
ncbi:hypothetical protein CF327_g6534 [Tilletia walkeri]|nr:hypothetical protein CF327_g6534 [Tilletia walkeri]